MRKKILRKVVGTTLTVAMAASLTACNKGADTTATTAAAAPTEATTEDSTPWQYQVRTKDDGSKIDLGGMEIVIRDWWSGELGEPQNAFEEAQREYWDWIQKEYNFTIKQQQISTWASAPQDFTDYVGTGGDDNNYIFILRSGKELGAAVSNKLMYDVASLNVFDFSEDKWSNNVHSILTRGDKVYGFSAEGIEPKGGMYFNKRLLEASGKWKTEDIYDLQEKGEWTWEKFEEICKDIQVDNDNDGTPDAYAMVNFASTFYNEAVFSNEAEFIGKDASGKLVNKLESNETLEALNWAYRMLQTYDFPQPEGSEWNYWSDAFINGNGCFIAGETYQAGQDWKDMEDDFGFVCFPKGPHATDYRSMYNDNPFVIPACYDADRAWAIAFAYDLYTQPVPGFEDYNGRTEAFYNAYRDTESVDLTVKRLYENGIITYHLTVPGLDLGPDVIWGINADSTPAQQAEKIRDTWANYLEEANK